VSGIEPTLENGKSGKFPVSRKLYMYIDENKVTGEAKKFIDYLLGADGQKLVKDAGFISINQ
jgi:phosphate transport system substrate-binding protein